MNETTVMSFTAALEAGYESLSYSWLTAAVLLGLYEARLDFMIWSKKRWWSIVI